MSSKKAKYGSRGIYNTRTQTEKVTVVCDKETFQVGNGGHEGLNLVTVLKLDQRADLPDVDTSEEVAFSGTEIFLTNDHGSVAAQLPAGSYVMNPRKAAESTGDDAGEFDLDNLPTVTYGAYIFKTEPEALDWRASVETPNETN